jgi:hypothetical protein
MSKEKLTPKQISALVVLMSQARELTNPELEQLVGFTLTGKDKNALVDRKLIESRKTAGGAFAHQLTDEGWRTCKQLTEISGGLPTGSTLGRALYVLLSDTRQALGRLNVSHADFFAPAEETTADDLSARIRSAYWSLARKPGDWVGLAALRPWLGTTPRADVDRALIELIREPGVHIIPSANLKALTSADRAGALRIGDQDAHAIAIEQR